MSFFNRGAITEANNQEKERQKDEERRRKDEERRRREREAEERRRKEREVQAKETLANKQRNEIKKQGEVASRDDHKRKELSSLAKQRAAGAWEKITKFKPYDLINRLIDLRGDNPQKYNTKALPLIERVTRFLDKLISTGNPSGETREVPSR